MGQIMCFLFRTRIHIVRFLLALALVSFARAESVGPKYESFRDEKFPVTVHVVKIPRQERKWEIKTLHADEQALGLENLTAQLTHLNLKESKSVAAINGDYYIRSGPFAGDPRGLQIVRGEIISAPAEGASFWIDALDQPNVGVTSAKFQVHWPDGSSAPIELNSAGRDDGLVLYTPAVGKSVKGRGGADLILERDGKSPWLPLRPGKIYSAKVRSQERARETQIEPETIVLSVGRKASAPKLKPGDIIKISTETQPSLRGVAEAVSGGPILLRGGKRHSIKAPGGDSYESSSMFERHPRSAIGWNDEYYFLVSVDGRQTGVSVGMTLEEFSAQLAKIGCTDAINLDGGGSATLWFEGKIRNYLCDGYERKIANSLAVIEKAGAK
jgi:hypothetical protein